MVEISAPSILDLSQSVLNPVPKSLELPNYFLKICLSLPPNFMSISPKPNSLPIRPAIIIITFVMIANKNNKAITLNTN